MSNVFFAEEAQAGLRHDHFFADKAETDPENGH